MSLISTPFKNVTYASTSGSIIGITTFDVPTEGYLGSRIDQDYQPEQVQEKRNSVLETLARALNGFWKETYLALNPALQHDFSQAMGERALKNIMLSMMARQGDDEVFELAYTQYQTTGNMSERLGALRVLVWNDAPQAQQALDDFYNRYKDEALSLDQWFMIQAANLMLQQRPFVHLLSIQIMIWEHQTVYAR